MCSTTRETFLSRAAAVLVGLSLIGLPGCGSEKQTRTFTAEDETDHGDMHDHAHAHGPHGGHIIELGGEDYHAELTFDAASRKLTVYLLESDVKTPLPVDAASLAVRLKIGEETQELTLAATPLEGETEGKASQFVLVEGSVPESIKDEEDLHGQIVVSFGGQQYRGEITHDHGHHH